MAGKNAPWKAKMEITLPQLIESFLAAKNLFDKFRFGQGAAVFPR